MSIGRTWRIASTSPDTTSETGAAVGASLRGGEVIELISDLGGGKTTFIRGLARGMGSHDAVRSPSFTLSNEYKAGKLTLYHFDFYRLSEPGLMSRELTEVLGDQQAVTVIEWAGIVHNVLPVRRLIIGFKVTGETSRELNFACDEELAYLFPFNT